MSKRRINKQQVARIEKMQAQYRQKTDILGKDGLILSCFGRHAEVEDSQGNCIHCSIRPNLDSLVAGDRIVWQPEGNAQGIVVSRYPRQSILSRSDKRGALKPVAANISQVIVVAAAKPELAWPLLDSYLIMAEHLAL
jgi:ribosome biogenesis GTPase